jgi:hypothetical protein
MNPYQVEINNTGLYRGRVEVQVDYPLIRMANSWIYSQDWGFSGKIITQ